MDTFDQLIVNLKQALVSELPGGKAHQLLAPLNRSLPHKHDLTNNPTYRVACVMILIYPLERKPHVVFIERTDHGSHAGQIALPGGKTEPGENFIQSAIRETYEEIGIDLNETEILGQLTEVFIPPSNFLVYPFIGVKFSKPEFFIEPLEVKRIIEIPLHAFLHPEVIQVRDFINSGLMVSRAPFYNLYGIEIWGATAMIISELSYIIKTLVIQDKQNI